MMCARVVVFVFQTFTAFANLLATKTAGILGLNPRKAGNSGKGGAKTNGLLTSGRLAAALGILVRTAVYIISTSASQIYACANLMFPHRKSRGYFVPTSKALLMEVTPAKSGRFGGKKS